MPDAEPVGLATRGTGIAGTSARPRSTRLSRLAPSSVPGTLTLLLLLIVVPALVVQGLIYVSRLETRTQKEYQANLEVARAVAAAFESFIRDILHQQLAVGRALAMAGDRLPAEETQWLLAASAREYPAIVFYNWLDPEGRVIASSQLDAVGLEFADRAYVQEVIQGRQWMVSDLLQGRLTGNATFVVARAIRDPRGELQGIMTAAVDPRLLGVVLSIPRDEQGAVSIIDRQGRGVYRYPEVDWTWEQRDWAATQPIVAEALAGQELTGNFVSIIDGRVRMSGLAPIPSIGWVAGANRPRELALAPVQNDLLRDFGVLALAVAAAVLVAVQVSRLLTAPLRRLREHALALGQGKLPPPLAIDRPTEFRQVAGAFEHMVAEIRARDAQREELLAILSHDIRNPLTAIRGQAQLARRRLARGDPPDRNLLLGTLGGIEDAVVRIDGLIEQLRSPASLVGRTPDDLLPTAVDLVALARAAVEAQRRVSDQHHWRLAAGDPHLAGAWDGGALQRVIDNLLGNAVKYSPPGSQIVVTVGRDGDDAVMSVTDEGIGIPATDLPFVFLPNQRGQNVGTTDGTGLGLASAHQIVAQHGGTITVQSQEGQGSTFTVRLPLQPDRASSPSEMSPQHNASAG
jgi:signal transduction histidine kinase